jgi:hypothetical protein
MRQAIATVVRGHFEAREQWIARWSRFSMTPRRNNID